jgi:hypothetical protein
MNKEKLQQHLVSDSSWLYGVLDGASVPELPMRLYETRAPNFCLFSGDLEPDMLYAAPYVVQLLPGNDMFDLVLNNGLGKHWGIFALSPHSIREMRRHFRSLVQACDERGKPLIFRFYDPRVLNRYLPTCTEEELETFFGKVYNFVAESEDGKSLTSYALEKGTLKQTVLN